MNSILAKFSLLSEFTEGLAFIVTHLSTHGRSFHLKPEKNLCKFPSFIPFTGCNPQFCCQAVRTDVKIKTSPFYINTIAVTLLITVQTVILRPA